MTLSSCAEFRVHRSYVDEMSQEDFSFYNPGEDFPLVAGDVGRSWYTDKEFRQRTPKSEKEMTTDRVNRYLQEELRSLEASLSAEEAEYYNKYGHKLSTTSEKIYFLKLPAYDQQEYLISRGLFHEERTPAGVATQNIGVKSQSVSLGMNKDQVMDIFGKPSRVEVAGSPRYENERWLYVDNGASRYIYFEGGLVQGWE